MTDDRSVSTKLDSIIASQALSAAFTATEQAQIKASVAFTEAFHNDPDTLNRMVSVFTAMEGWIKITRVTLIVLGVIVVAWTQWDRFLELMGKVK